MITLEQVKQHVNKIGLIGIISLIGTGWFLFSVYADIQTLKQNQWTEEKDRKIVREEIQNAQKDKELEYLKKYLFQNKKGS
jgi:hypothetical protein